MIGDDIARARKKAKAAGLAVQALATGVSVQVGKVDYCFRFTIVNEGMARQAAQQLRKPC